jgi:hypothetical protein
VGPVRGVNVEATVELDRSWGGDGVKVYARTQSGVALALVIFSGGLDHPALVPGAHLFFDAYGEGAATQGHEPLSVITMGCADRDPEAGLEETEFDEMATDVEVDVSEGEGDTRIFLVTSRVPNAGAYGEAATLTARFAVP